MNRTRRLSPALGCRCPGGGSGRGRGGPVLVPAVAALGGRDGAGSPAGRRAGVATPCSGVKPAASQPPVPQSPVPQPPVPQSSQPAAPAELATGTLISHEHRTTGTVRVVRAADGSLVLRLENLATSSGPDVHVWLTDAPVRPGKDGWDVFDDGKYLDAGKLKGNKGNQNYSLPAGTDLAGYTSVSLWCDRFNVSFGAAELTGRPA